MLKLIIKERGHMIELPGMAPFRTPAEVDVSKLSLNVLILKMKNYNINEYEIRSEIGGKAIVYKKDDVEKKKLPDPAKKKEEVDKINDLNARFSRLEKLLLKAVGGSKTGSDWEQINEKIDKLSNQVNDIKVLKEVVIKDSGGTKRTKITKEEDEDKFIPQIETSGMKIKSGDRKKLKREDDTDDAADLLSKLTNK